MTVWNAPVPFFTALLLASWAIWRIIQREFATRLANADSTIQMLERQIDRQGMEQAIAMAAGPDHSPPASELLPPPPAPAALKPTPATLENARELDKGITVETLMNVYRRNTKIAAEEILARYLGARMTVTGPVAQVSRLREEISVTLGVTQMAFAFCYFQEADNQVTRLRKDETATVSGALVQVGSFGVELTDCKLISGPPSADEA